MKTDHCTQQHAERCSSRSEWQFKSAKLKRRNGAAPLPSVRGADLPGVTNRKQLERDLCSRLGVVFLIPSEERDDNTLKC